MAVNYWKITTWALEGRPLKGHEPKIDRGEVGGSVWALLPKARRDSMPVNGVGFVWASLGPNQPPPESSFVGQTRRP